MAATREQMMEMDPEEVFEWEVDNLDVGLKQLNVTVGVKWTKPKKAYELCNAIRQLQVPNASDLKSNNHVQSTDPNVLMFQALQSMVQAQQKAMEAAEERSRQDQEAQ